MRLKNSLAWLGAAAASLMLAQPVSASQPLPIPFTGPAHANPAGELHYQDITIIQRQSDKTFFRISKSNSTGLGMSVATAPDFRGPWTYQYSILNTLVDPLVTNRSDTDVWAPDIYLVNGTYYLYYSIFTGRYSEPKSTFDLCVATSKTLEADDWTDHGSMGVPAASDGQYVRLDSNLVANSSNPSTISDRYMVWDSFHWGLYAMGVTPDYLRATGTPKLLTADEYVPSTMDKHNRTEGAYFLQDGNCTYLWYSQGSCCSGLHPNATVQAGAYETFVCRSEHGPQGPYIDVNGNPCDKRQPGIGTVFLQNSHDGQVYAPGSVGILSDPAEGGLVMWYQYYNLTAEPPLGMQFGWNYLSFNATGWPELSRTR